LASDLFDISRRLLQWFQPAASEGHVGSGTRQGKTHGLSQSGAAAGHHRCFIREGKSFENHAVLLVPLVEVADTYHAFRYCTG
jgi:hypothetical protein